METQNYTKEFLTAYGIFVGFYNRVNNTSFSVKDALKEPTLMSFYTKVSQAANVVNQKVKQPEKKTTKRKAYDALNIPEIDNAVLQYIHNNQDSSRWEIAAGTGLRVSTVCGAVNRLVYNKFAFISGEKTDEETNRSVDTVGSLYVL